MSDAREQWSLLSLYERFEQVVAIVLSLIIAMVITMALIQLIRRVLPLLLSGAVDPLDRGGIQGLFGTVMTLLIALEFKHSIIRVAIRRDNIVHVKTVILVSLMR